MRVLIVTSIKAEAEAIGAIEDARVLVCGVGRTNAAAATTEAILRAKAPFDAVMSAGVAGALPGSNLELGEALVASNCVYHEEGLITSKGFVTMSCIGFPLGDFEGNCVPVDERLLEVLSGDFRIGPIATVATCSGTSAAAAEVARRTGALAEAMEGAAVVHAARRLKVPAIELRTISNTTGDRSAQQWDLARGLEALGKSLTAALALLRSHQ